MKALFFFVGLTFVRLIEVRLREVVTVIGAFVVTEADIMDELATRGVLATLGALATIGALSSGKIYSPEPLAYEAKLLLLLLF